MTLIIILSIIVCAFLIFIVFIQNPKGGGIAAGFSAGNQIMGVRRTNEFVEKATWTMAGALLVLCLASNLFAGAGSNAGAVQESSLKETIQKDGTDKYYTPAPSSTTTGGQGGGVNIPAN